MSAVVAVSMVAATIAWTRPVSARSVLAGWAACYLIPIALIAVRGVPLGKVVRISGTILLCGLPVAGLLALAGFAVSGEVGLIGVFGASILSLGWGSLYASSSPPFL